MLSIFETTHGLPPSVPLTQDQLDTRMKNTWINEKMASMSAEEKVGQILMWHIEDQELTSASAKLLSDVPFGGVIIMGDHTKESLKKLVDQIQMVPSVVPRFIAVDQEGGLVKRLIDDIHPGASSLSEASFSEFCEIYRKTAHLLKSSGVNMNLGIIADIGWFQDGYISSRTFGNNETVVADLVGRAATCSSEILTAVKHFPGHGRTKLDSHTTIPVIKIPYDEWIISDALPFRKAIDEHIPVIMLGHLIYDQMASEPASLSPYWIQTIRDTGYSGLIMTDDLGMLETSRVPLKQSIERALHAGADMLLFVSPSEKPETIFRIAQDQIRQIRATGNTFEDTVRRILAAKYALRSE